MIAAQLAIWASLVFAPVLPQQPPLSLQATAPREPPPAAQVVVDLGSGLHLGQGAGVLDLHLGWRIGRWELGVFAENVADLPGWDVQRDERTLFALSSRREPGVAEDLVLEPRNPWNVSLFVAFSF